MIKVHLLTVFRSNTLIPMHTQAVTTKMLKHTNKFNLKFFRAFTSASVLSVNPEMRKMPQLPARLIEYLCR